MALNAWLLANGIRVPIYIKKNYMAMGNLNIEETSFLYRNR